LCKQSIVISFVLVRFSTLIPKELPIPLSAFPATVQREAKRRFPWSAADFAGSPPPMAAPGFGNGGSGDPVNRRVDPFV